MQVHPVSSKEESRNSSSCLIGIIVRPLWVPPLKSEQRGQYDPIRTRCSIIASIAFLY